MKFLWCTLSVKDLEESLKFYQEIVGLDLRRRFKAGPTTEIVFLGEGETEIELISGPDYKAPGLVEGVTLGFKVDSVDRMIAFIQERGLKVDSGPFQPNPNLKFFFVRDPNGVNVQFVEDM